MCHCGSIFSSCTAPPLTSAKKSRSAFERFVSTDIQISPKGMIEESLPGSRHQLQSSRRGKEKANDRHHQHLQRTLRRHLLRQAPAASGTRVEERTDERHRRGSLHSALRDVRRVRHLRVHEVRHLDSEPHLAHKRPRAF
nr:MAG TPA: hypothetical protein [Caudoviricetes sp.]